MQRSAEGLRKLKVQTTLQCMPFIMVVLPKKPLSFKSKQSPIGVFDASSDDSHPTPTMTDHDENKVA